MLLLLLRHAHAGQRDPIHYADDSLRPMSAEGKKTTQRLAHQFAQWGLAPSAVFSSPWLRARQTAEALVRSFPPERRVPIQLCSPLTGSPNLRALARAVGDQPPGATVVLVGHQPWLGETASILLLGAPSKLQFDLPKCGVIGIETHIIKARRGTLRLLLPAPVE